MSIITKHNYTTSLKTRAKYFEQIKATRSPRTLTKIRYCLRSFDVFCMEKLRDPELDEIVNGDTIIKDLMTKVAADKQTEVAIDVLQQYVNYRTERVKPYTIMTSFYAIPNYMYWMGLKIDQRDIKQVQFPKRKLEEKHSLVMKELEMLIASVRDDYAAYYTALASTGMRPGEGLAVKKKDMRWYKDHYFVTVRAETSKTLSEREVILSTEAADLIKDRVDAIGLEEWVYMPNVQGKDRLSPVGVSFTRRIKKLNIGIEGKRPTLHRFRSFFMKQATTSVSADYGHRILGHGGYLPTYGNLTDDEKLEKYMQVEPEVTIKNYYKKKLHDTTMEDRIKELEIKLQAKELPVSKV